MANKRKQGIPFWLQIAVIIVVGVAASAVVWITMTAKPPRDIVKHKVTFAYADGTIIETKEVEDGKGVYPPEISHKGVFRGWSAGFNRVTEDVEVHPVFHAIKEDNLFYFDSVYVKEGDQFSLELCLGGKVNVSSGVLTLIYDTEVLEYVPTSENALCEITQGEAGEVTIVFDSDSPITKESALAQLTFIAKKKDAYSTEVGLSAKDVMIVSNGQNVPADCATINNAIYFLQEVG